MPSARTDIMPPSTRPRRRRSESGPLPRRPCADSSRSPGEENEGPWGSHPRVAHCCLPWMKEPIAHRSDPTCE